MQGQGFEFSAPESNAATATNHFLHYETIRQACREHIISTSAFPAAPFARIELLVRAVDYRADCSRRITLLNTLFLLMAQYDGRVIVPAEIVCRDYFSHLTITKFLRKVSTGEIDLPLTRAERSQKSAKGVHLQDLASYIDKRREIALSEARAFRIK
ncbi:pyocin activator PrtN family protein [Rhodobium orientis]|uniref:pyocin activator PrtN family protein n=1 Tax=Rhodobium orientis TaxID=34017 RepID=UPI003B8355AA